MAPSTTIPTSPGPGSTRATLLVFDGVTLLDALGPYDALRRLPMVEIHLCAVRPGPVRAGGGLGVQADVGGERVTQVGKIWTAAGVTAGIDLGLHLCKEIAGEERARAVQLAMEDGSPPPFAVGDATQEPALVRIVEEELR